MPHCAMSGCHSNSYSAKYGPLNLNFMAFPKPHLSPNRAKRWAYLTGRGDSFTDKDITRNSYICSLHFDLKENESKDWRVNKNLEPYHPNLSSKPWDPDNINWTKCKVKIDFERLNEIKMKKEELEREKSKIQMNIKTYSRKKIPVRFPLRVPKEVIDYDGGQNKMVSMGVQVELGNELLRGDVVTNTNTANISVLRLIMT